jgi:hypothetical protein
MSLPPFTGPAPSPIPKITIADVPIMLHNLRKQIMENNAMTKAAARTKAVRVINDLKAEERFDDDETHQEALNLVPSIFTLTGGRYRSRSRRSKKRSNRKKNATRRN